MDKLLYVGWGCLIAGIVLQKKELKYFMFALGGVIFAFVKMVLR